MIQKKSYVVRAAMTVFLAAVVSVAARGRPVWASDTINKVSIRVTSNLEAGDDRNEPIEIDDKEAPVSLSTTSDKYAITDAKWSSTSGGRLQVGEEPKIVVTLTPTDESEDYFKSSYAKKDCSISGGTFVSARTSGADLVVTLRIKAVKGNFPAPDDAYWDENVLGKAQWKMDESSGGAYDVWLYRGNSAVHKESGLRTKNLNLYPYMTQEGTYTFRVRVSPYTEQEKKGGKSSEWTESEELTIRAAEVSDGSELKGKNEASTQSGSTASKGWYKNNGNWHYRNNDGEDIRGDWLELGDTWYLFQADGRMITGWHQQDGNWYYLDSEGRMVTGWQKISGRTYYFNPSWSDYPVGAALTGWNIIDGYTYYFNPEDASMYKGWIHQVDSWYYLNELEEGDLAGVMLKGWIYRNGLYYYTDEYGVMQTGWKEIDGNWYYLDPSDGHKATDTLINGFYVDRDGIWREGE